MTIINWKAGLTLAAIGLASPTLGIAHEDEASSNLCNVVLDSSGNAVISGNADVVVHSGTKECPEVETVAVVAEPESTVEAELQFVERNVYFPFDVAELTPDARAEIENAVAESAERQAKRVLVLGHTDLAGPSDYNLNLSAKRAENVEDALIAAGLPTDVIDTEAQGESNPAVETADGVKMRANRRAVIRMEY